MSVWGSSNNKEEGNSKQYKRNFWYVSEPVQVLFLVLACMTSVTVTSMVISSGSCLDIKVNARGVDAQFEPCVSNIA